MGSSASSASKVALFPEEAAVKSVVARKGTIASPTPEHVQTNGTKNGGNGENRRKRPQVNSSSDELVIKRVTINDAASATSSNRRDHRDIRRFPSDESRDKRDIRRIPKDTSRDERDIRSILSSMSRYNRASRAGATPRPSNGKIYPKSPVVLVDGRLGDAVASDFSSNPRHNDDTDNLSLISRDDTEIMFLAVQGPWCKVQSNEPATTDDDSDDDEQLERIERREKTDADFIEIIARENQDITAKRRYEVGTIGYYIAKSDHGTDRYDNEGADAIVTEKLKEAMYEELKRREAANEDSVKEQKKSSPARVAMNRQTVVLRKFGWRYKYVTVPAYLPGQRLRPLRRSVQQSVGLSFQDGRHTAPSQGHVM